MVWVCRECGLEVEARDAVLVTTMGWTAVDGDRGVCPPCSRREAETATTATPAVHQTRQRLEASERAITMSRAGVGPARASRWDDRSVRDAATRLGFALRPCQACHGSPDARCTQCDGRGVVWQREDVTLSPTALLSSGMLPARR